MKLQSKLALTCTLIATPVLFLLATSIYLIAKDRIYSAVDATLQTKAETIRSAVNTWPESITETSVVRSIHALDRLAAQGTTFSVLGVDGSLAYSSVGTGFPEPANLSQRTVLSTAEGEGERTRILHAPFIQFGEVIGYIEVRASLAAADSALADIRLAMVIGGLAAVAAIVLPGYLLAGRIVEPVRRASELARSIEATSDFARRLPTVSSPQEVEELTSTFNALLQRLETMIAAQKAFFAESSHELRRPLTILRTNIDVLALPGLPSGERTKIQEEMQVEAAAMSRLLSQLLLLSRGDLARSTPDQIDVSSLCRRSLARFAEYCRDHSVTAEIEPGLFVLGDGERLAQLVDNLLENAHHYTGAGGGIDLRLRSIGTLLMLEVTDSGAGMSEEERKQAFNRFFRGHAGRRSNPEGFGLGLAIVKHVAESHSGSVTIYSQVGVGTTCVVSLPKFVPLGIDRGAARHTMAETELMQR